jgi:hypothetical protein
MSWEQKAKAAYINDTPNKLRKAMAAGRAIDNALAIDYSDGGINGHGAGRTDCHFMTSNWLAYFSYEALGKDRLLLFIKSG